MAMLDENHVLVHGFLMWDGIGRAETLDDGGKKYSLKIAVDPNDQQGIQDLHNLEQRQINEGKFKGNLPAGANRAIGQVGQGETFSEHFPGYYVVNGITYQPPQVVNAATGQDLQPMAYAPKLYAGARVGIILSPREYDNKQRGVGWWLGGVGVYLDDKSPQIQVGGGGYDARQAFGGGGNQQQPQGQPQQNYGNQQQQPYQGQPQPQQQGYGNQQQPQQQPYQGSPQPQGHQVPPNQAQPDPNFGGNQQQPQGQPQQNYGNQQQQPYQGQPQPQQQGYGNQQQPQQHPQGHNTPQGNPQQQGYGNPQGNGGYGPQ